MFDTTVAWTITAPAGVDGRGEVAVLNTAGGNFVGWLNEITRSVNVRQSADDNVEAHGAQFGSFYYGQASYTLTVEVAKTFAARDKLWRATEALAADGTIVFTEVGGVAKQINFRRAEYPQGPDQSSAVVMVGLTSKDARVWSSGLLTGSSPTTNAGNANSPPTFTFTPTANGTVVITNTTAGLGSPALTLTVGTGYLLTGSAVTVDFGARTVVQGGTNKYNAIVFPTSVWWDLIPGSNSWTVSNASSVSISARSAWI